MRAYCLRIFYKLNALLARPLIVACRIYQVLLSPYLGNHCRFAPSCSEYMRLALERFGLVRGLFLGIKRLFRCHAASPGGLDPVPEKP